MMVCGDKLWWLVYPQIQFQRDEQRIIKSYLNRIHLPSGCTFTDLQIPVSESKETSRCPGPAARQMRLA